MDSYEENLLELFESCNDFYQGSLGAAGLHELCEKLRLEDSYQKLTHYLLTNQKTERIFFQDFKESLLQLLESEQKTHGEHLPGKKFHSKHNDKLNGDEVKPGSSESEPQHSPQVPFGNADDNSSEESFPKKRKTRSKRKEKKFLNTFGCEKEETSRSPMNEVEHLVTAWGKVSRGARGSLGREELVEVLECVGLERDSEAEEAAECIFDKLDVGADGSITLEELLEFIRSGGRWSEGGGNRDMEPEASRKSGSAEVVEAPGLGCVTGAYLLERWESAGVPSALQLLQNLGYSPAQQIDISSLVALLSEEVNNLNEEFKSSNKRGMDPQVALLRANSVLQNLYIQTLKTTVEHLNAEKEKLRNDVLEANQRAVFLAQEVDDHHSKLEHSAQQQVKVLEQKHAERMREITSRAKAEQDALVTQNLSLERRVQSLEVEEGKNRAVICQLEKEAKLSEQEHRAVVDQLHSVQLAKEKLEKELENASLVQQKVSEMESVLNETEVAPLLERIRILELEKTNLRDRNDELCVEVEELSAKLLNSSSKKRSNSGVGASSDPPPEESVGGGAVKRRVDAFLLLESAEDSGGEEDSPRLGKVRKCSHGKDFCGTSSSLKGLQMDGGSEGECKEELGPADAKDEDVSDCKSENSYEVLPFSKELDQVNCMSLNPPSFQAEEDWCDDVKDILKNIHEKLKKHDAMLSSEVMFVLRRIITEKRWKKLQEVEESMKTRCQELEASLELLREEYERTEDYWSEKLEEERSLFEEEQKLSDKKYSELLEKILEYEETLNAEKEQKQRLETIEEKDSLERQVADMEQECVELRSKLAETLEEKKLETERLKEEMERLKVNRKCSECVECGVQTASVETSVSVAKEEGERVIRGVRGSEEDFGNRSSNGKEREGLNDLFQSKLKWELEIDLMKGEKDRLFQKINELKRNLNGRNVNGKVQELEEKCESLLVTLKQQQKQTEDILKNTWKQHKAEMKDLKSILRMTEEKLKRQTKVIQEQLAKLVRTDLLVKDLFVENAFLVSSVQKLERQCQCCGSGSSSSL